MTTTQPTRPITYLAAHAPEVLHTFTADGSHVLARSDPYPDQISTEDDEVILVDAIVPLHHQAADLIVGATRPSLEDWCCLDLREKSALADVRSHGDG